MEKKKDFMKESNDFQKEDKTETEKSHMKVK